MRSRAHLVLVPNEDVDADQRKDAPERWQDAIQDVVRCIRARRLPPRRVGHSVRRKEEDFGALCRVARLAKVPFVVIVKPDSPVKNVADLTALLKGKGVKARYGASTNTAIVTAELYREMAGIQLEQIKYNNVADALRGLLADEFDFAAYDATWVASMAQSGRVKPIAVTSTTRLEAMPDVPTMEEQGFKGFDLTPWWGAVVPAGTPKPIIDRLAGWFKQINDDPETKAFLGKFATETWTGGPEDLRALLANELTAWGKYIALAKIEKQ